MLRDKHVVSDSKSLIIETPSQDVRFTLKCLCYCRCSVICDNVSDLHKFKINNNNNIIVTIIMSAHQSSIIIN